MGRRCGSAAARTTASAIDLISCGWITHSAPILDLGPDIAD
jgi:nicotinate-nucleotide pyrophosphorylase